MKEKDTKPMVTKSNLKSERGWTDKLIKIFLPTPDIVKQNPKYKKAPPMQLFYTDRIETIEQTEEFQSQKEIASKRKQSAKKAIETKLQKLREWLNEVEIEVPILTKEALVKQACDHYNEMQLWRAIEGRDSCDMKATPKSDKKFLDRICVNYLRHCLTDYEEHLDDMSGKVGFLEGYFEIRNKIFKEIAKCYSWLKNECNRQN